MSIGRIQAGVIISIAVAIVAVVALEAIPHHNTPAPHRPADTNTTTGPAPSRPSTPAKAPTIDLNGNRLDIPADGAGEALPQNPGTRPDPRSPAYLTTPPAGLDWQRSWGGAALPVSASDGPEKISNGIASGFADTPQGAALAACDALARTVAAPDGVWQNVIRERYLGGGQALIDRIARSRTSTPDAAEYAIVPDGIRVLTDYRPDFAVVQIAVRASDGWAYGVWPMAWSGGDWRVRVPDDLETLWQPAVPVADLSDFGQWRSTP
ncbi:hypothetical protein ABIA39_007547 [Nocardia sp. GAS34]|uniref:hypothetical protein n=1 Tax=unclassified Nocardia TaxID=2637762 RepID=UPI003D1C918C